MDGVYVQNLPPNVSIKDVYDFFRPFGKLVNIDLNNRCNPVSAFVQFENISDACNAVRAKSGYDYDGYTLQVKLVENKNQSRQETASPTPPPPPPILNNLNIQSNTCGFDNNISMNPSSFQSKIQPRNIPYRTSCHSNISSENMVAYPTPERWRGISNSDVFNRRSEGSNISIGSNAVTDYSQYNDNSFEDMYTQDLTECDRVWFNLYIRQGFSPKMAREKAFEHRKVPYQKVGTNFNKIPKNSFANLSKLAPLSGAGSFQRDSSIKYPQTFNMSGRNSTNYDNRSYMSRSRNSSNREGRPEAKKEIGKRYRQKKSGGEEPFKQSDLQNVCSDTSRATIKDKLDVRTGVPFVRLNSSQKRLFKQALDKGLTREQALEFAQALPPERVVTKGTLNSNAKEHTTMEGQITVVQSNGSNESHLQSVCSDTSKTTIRDKLDVRTGVPFIRLNYSQKRLFKKGLADGLTREQALVFAQAIPAEGDITKLTSDSSAEEHSTIKAQITVVPSECPLENCGAEKSLKESIDNVPQELSAENFETNTETIDSKLQSICSDSSGDTIRDKSLDKMNMNTSIPYIKLKTTERRRLKRALVDGLTRDQALVFARATPSERAIMKGTLDSENFETNTEKIESDECLDKKDVPTDVPYIRLKTTEKRRLNRALARGLSREQALLFARNPPQGRRGAMKRALSDEKAVPTKKTTKTNTNTYNATKQENLIKPTNSGVVGTVNLGFISNDMSSNPLTDEQIYLLEEAIIDTLIEFGDDVQLEFEGYFPRTGWLMVTCSNRKTADFIIRNIQAVRDKCKIELSIVDESQFPR